MLLHHQKISNPHQKLLAKNLAAPNETMICALTEDSDQPVPKGLVTLRCLHGESLRFFK